MTTDHFSKYSIAYLMISFLAGCGGTSFSSSSDTAAAALSQSASTDSCIDDAQCKTGQFCHFATSNACGVKGTKGKCTDVSAFCPYLCAPVCGCDGVTYDNYCLANKAGSDIAFSGFCERAPTTMCWSKSSGQSKCTWATAQSDCNPNGNGAGYQGPAGDSNFFCNVDQQCQTIQEECGGTELGRVRGLDGKDYATECDAYWKGRVDYLCHYSSGSVCAVDTGVTYSSECDAIDAGVKAYMAGPC